MQTRRGFLFKLGAGFAAMALVVGGVLADELLGVITKVDVEGKKFTVLKKGTDKEIEIQVNDETEVVSKKGTSRIDLKKMEKGVKKIQDEYGKKGLPVKITHEKGVASKIEVKYAQKKAD